VNKIKAVIVDDERLARKELASMLKEFDEIEIIGEADGVNAALKLIEENTPDIIFLDIQMPGESGFDLVNKGVIDKKVIFVTAYDEYAIRAFEINALDYLLKPINPKRLKQSIQRLHESMETTSHNENKLEYNDRLFLSLNNKHCFIKIENIVSIKAAGDYSELVTTSSEKGLTLKTMKEWEHRLPEQYFARVHRSTIVNMEHILKLEDWFNNSYRIYMKGIEEPLIMSRRYVSKIKAKMS
jgi:two-component system LytT family response regulator